MKNNSLMNHYYKDLFGSYKKAKCKCIIKGYREPSLVDKRNAKLHFRSNKNPSKARLADLLCRNQTQIDLVFYISLLMKIQDPMKRLITSYFLYSQIFN